MKDLLQKQTGLYSLCRFIYKYIYRNVLKNKYVYLLSRSSKPISNRYGFDRGVPIDRYYIEHFLLENSNDIKGKCMELLNGYYMQKYGGDHIIEGIVLDIDQNNKDANLIADLRDLKDISDNVFDCIILTQVLHLIDDISAAISECHRVLKSGGTLLATLPALSRIDCLAGMKGDYWRFTKAGARFMFEKFFKSDKLFIASAGNAKSGIYFYAGLAQQDISRTILSVDDENFPLIITVRAIK